MTNGKPKIAESRQFRNFDANSFHADINQAPWHLVHLEDNPNRAWEIWSRLFLEICDFHAPPKRTRKVRNNYTPWLTPEIKRLMFERTNWKGLQLSTIQMLIGPSIRLLETMSGHLRRDCPLYLCHYLFNLSNWSSPRLGRSARSIKKARVIWLDKHAQSLSFHYYYYYYYYSTRIPLLSFSSWLYNEYRHHNVLSSWLKFLLKFTQLPKHLRL